MQFRSPLKISLAFFGLILSIRATATESDATVYYLPFKVETYVAVTKATIETAAAAKWTISDQSRATRLVSLLNGGVKVEAKQFDENRVRVKVIAGAQIYFVDSEGVVQRGKKTVRIDVAD